MTVPPRPSRPRLRTALVALVAVLGAALAVHAPAAAQGLSLDPVPPAPALPARSATAVLVETLRGELAQLDTRLAELAPDDRKGRAATQARQQLRRLALDLLARGAEPGGVRDALAMHGFRLADVRRRVDILVGAFADDTLRVGDPPAPLGVRQRDLAVRRLERFVEVSPKAFAAATLSDREQIDATVAAATTDLGDAIAVLEGMRGGEVLGSGWPTPEELASARTATGASPSDENQPTDPAADLDPCDDANLASLSPKTGAAMRARCAAGDADLARLRVAAAFARAGAAALWLSQDERAALDERAARIAAVVGTPGTDTDLADALADLLDADTFLGVALATTKLDHDIDRASLESTLRLALFPDTARTASGGTVAFASDPSRLARAVARVTSVLRTSANAYARETPANLSRETKTLLRDFERAYRRAERTTYERLSALLTSADALSDPELVSLGRIQRDALLDIERVTASQRLVDAIGGVKPSAAPRVASHVRTVLRWLLEPARRGAALVTYEALEAQVGLFVPLPFEEELRRESDEAITLTGAQPRALIDAIDASRAAWADAWANGEGSGPAAKHMLELYRLMRFMDAFASGISAPETRDDIALLTRWGAFHATRASMSPAMVDVAASLKLATASAIAGDDKTLAAELDRLERHTPLIRLVGRLLDDARPWLEQRPDGATGVFAAIREPPSRSAWNLSQRDRLATLARFARELDQARRGRETESEAALLEYLASVSRSTLESLGEARSPIPPLPPLVEPATPPRKRDRK
ncbi:MAG: hypothetical protein JNM94_09500 [Phycisphaerae bacterium]|nr:hypothetical protein [Phycisphaerae bacterium]